MNTISFRSRPTRVQSAPVHSASVHSAAKAVEAIMSTAATSHRVSFIVVSFHIELSGQRLVAWQQHKLPRAHPLGLQLTYHSFQIGMSEGKDDGSTDSDGIVRAHRGDR